MKRKTVHLLQRIAIVVTTVLFGLTAVGSVIAFENASFISGELGAKTYEIVVDENAANEDTEYFKSDYGTLKEMIQAGKEMTTEAMAEGAILLKNENNALPLKEGARKISVFGITSADPVYSGTGSGKIDVTKVETLYNGMSAAGLELNPTLVKEYSTTWYVGVGNEETYDANKHFRRYVPLWAGAGGGYISGVPWEMVKTAAGDTFAAYGDAAIYVIARVGGEGADLSQTGTMDGVNGDYLHLSQREMDTLKGLKQLKDEGVFKKIIFIMNGAYMVHGDFLKSDEYGIDAALWVGNLGKAGAVAVGQILTGEVVPSGKTADTCWMSREAYPVNGTFGYAEYVDAEKYGIMSKAGDMFVAEPTLHVYTVYTEGMYLGYRYAETRYEDRVSGAAKAGNFDYEKVVAYPFGYGLSYTQFEYSNFKAEKNGRTYTLSVDVKNTGSEYSGKEAVQFYVSKPYGDYAKANQIQVPSVEMVEFDKTRILAPGESQTLTVQVDEKYFASYDAYGEGTYVLMEGDYYVIAAANAHDAVNNLLVAKGISGDGMVGEGRADLVRKFELAMDKTTYTVSDATGNPIHNLFDYVDLNRYEGRGENSVVYYDRSDWEGTVPADIEKAIPVLTANEQIADEILSQCPVRYNKPLPKDAEKMEYPKYGVQAGLKLIDMKGIDYNDPMWDTFMDQLTWDETAQLVSNGQHQTEMIESIAKPRCADQNGPNGFFRPYKTETSGLAYKEAKAKGLVNEKGKIPKNAGEEYQASTTGFCSNGTIAATFNKETAYKVGLIIGNDGLWSGNAGLYGVGCNLHRSPYQGRAAEYYSECSILTGIISGYECKGIEEKGVHVYNKHCALNDQEQARHGVGSWAREQAVRELYLRAFEIPIVEGNAYNVMSAFSRMGTQPGPSNTALAQDYLRGECGMKGLVVTDMYTDMDGSQNNSCYFELAYGLYYGGCDAPDGSDQEYQLTAYKPDASGNGDYATMGWRMREAAKRICYAALNSNAMNGISSSTKTVPITPTWQKMLTGVIIGLGALFLASLFWTIGYAIVQKKKS